MGGEKGLVWSFSTDVARVWDGEAARSSQLSLLCTHCMFLCIFASIARPPPTLLSRWLFNAAAFRQKAKAVVPRCTDVRGCTTTIEPAISTGANNGAEPEATSYVWTAHGDGSVSKWESHTLELLLVIPAMGGAAGAWVGCDQLRITTRPLSFSSCACVVSLAPQCLLLLLW